MKKNVKILFIVIIILSLLLPITYSYALSLVEKVENEKFFFEVSKTEVTKNEKIELILNLDNIEYNEFIFELKSDEVIENVEIAQNDEIEAKKNNNEIIMEINKEKTNVKTINLYYSIPENKQVGDTIKFIATITNITNNDNEEISKEETKLPIENEEIGKDDGEISTETTKSEETNVTINEKENLEIENNEENESETELNESIQETQSIEVEIKIVEKKEDDKQENNKEESQISNSKNNKQEIQKVQTSDKNNTSSSTVQKTPSSSSNYNNQVAKVTYNGSDNNYLSELSVEGYTFNRAFSKENTTYFITIGNEIEKLDITSKVDDDEASVNIYGNENLTEGTNKILITVTAENGNVRNYRIYVTKNI